MPPIPPSPTSLSSRSHRPLLSAALIVRDEADHLAACLESISGVVDEMIVVDTGSTDATVDVARRAGATVVCRPWDGHFDAARNAALDLARGRWILYIDADERLSAADGLRDSLATTNAVAGRIRFRPSRHSTRYREYRLFQNRPDIRFRGVIHETMVPDIIEVAAREGAPIIDVPGQIDHLGYEGDQLVKHRRNLPLLRRQIEVDPGRIYLWFHLGVVLDGLGDQEAAEAAWVQGVTLARRQAQPNIFVVPVYAQLAHLRILSGGDATDLAAEMIDRFPDDPLTVWVAAQVAMARDGWGDAVPLLERLAIVDGAEVVHSVLAYDERIFGEFAAHCLGLCHFHLGDDTRAEHWFSVACEAAPDNDEYRTKRRLAASRLGLSRR